MSVFQDKFTCDMGKLSQGYLDDVVAHAFKHQITGFIPTTFADATNTEVFGNQINIIKGLQKRGPVINTLIQGVDMAKTKSEFEKASSLIREIPGSIAIWNDSPEMLELYEDMREKERIPIPSLRGKGSNMWTSLLYRYATARGSSFVLWDSDIIPSHGERQIFGEHIPLSLIAPIVDPNFKKGYDFVKAYYTRLEQIDSGQHELKGRVTRLLVSPLLAALKKHFADVSGKKSYDKKELRDYLEFAQTFKYPLAGEFAMRSNVAGSIPIQTDWGLEIGSINELFGKKFGIAQIDLGIYDHKHTYEYPDDPDKGLNKMAEEVTKTIIRQMNAIMNGAISSENKSNVDEIFQDMLIDYQRYAEGAITKYYGVSHKNGWHYEPIEELKRVDIFKDAIQRAYKVFKEKPKSQKPLPVCGDVDNKYATRLVEIVEMQNPRL
ncbi:hypothetical protein GOV08_02535 [Candidatus Woesearchaeota archaeon]|nr:hypothetical protein [Candidatus Woesearchaeota archaeon]